MKFASNVLNRDPRVVVEFLDRMSCVDRILASKNRNLGCPLTPSELEDVGQEVLMLVWRKLPEFRGQSSLETWVYRIAVLEYMNRLRRANYRKTSDVSTTRLIEAAGAEEPPEIEDYSLIYEALGSLPEEERDVVQAKHFDQQSFSQIAVTLLIPENTAKTRYYRGLERLRRMLLPYAEDVA